MRKQEDASACSRCNNYDRRETEAGVQQEPTPPGAAGPQPRRPRNSPRIGSGLLVRGLLETAQAVVPHPKRDCPIQLLGRALDYARWREPRLGTTLRHIRDDQPCSSNISERSLRFACSPQSSVATGWTPLSPDLLVERKASRPPVSQLATIHRRDQATIGPASIGGNEMTDPAPFGDTFSS